MIGILIPAILTIALVAGGWFGWDTIQSFLPIDLPKLATLSGIGSVGMLISLINSFRNQGGILNLIFWLVMEAALGVLGDQMIGPTLVGRAAGPVAGFLLAGLAIVSTMKRNTSGRSVPATVTDKALDKALQAAGAPPGTNQVIKAMVKGSGGEEVDLGLLGKSGAVQSVRQLMEQIGDSTKLLQLDRQHIFEAHRMGLINADVARELLQATGLNAIAAQNSAQGTQSVRATEAPVAKPPPTEIPSPFADFRNSSRRGGR